MPPIPFPSAIVDPVGYAVDAIDTLSSPLASGGYVGVVAREPGKGRPLTTGSSIDWAMGSVLKSSAFLTHISIVC